MVSLSVLIITHGREELLLKCLNSLRDIDCQWQLVIGANGEELSESILKKVSELTANFKIVDLPQKLSPGEARNLCLHECIGDWVHFLDDDSFWTSGYWALVQTLLTRDDFDIYGGPDAPAPQMGPFSLSLAIALSSPFCTGMTFSRHRSLGLKLIKADEEKLTSCNLWVRKNKLNGTEFPVDYMRGEETKFLQELQIKGLKAAYHPKLKVYHYRRKKLSELWRPALGAGYFRSKVLKEKMGVGGEIFWLPSIFVLMHTLIFFDSIAFVALTKLYLGMIFTISFGLSVKAKKFYLFPMVAFFHYFIVTLYGLGFLKERLGFKWR